MRRTTPLAATALLGLVLLAPATGASAAEETCQGRTATIVGTPEGRLVGTPGADVIVSYGDSTVDAGDGDDLICLRPIVSGLVVQVDAGAGDDSVVSEGDQNNTWTHLGPGRDSFVGGGGEDFVKASFDDTVVVARGASFVHYDIAPGEALPATVGSISGLRSDGYTRVLAHGRRIRMDGRARTISVDGRVVATIGVVPRMLYGVAQHVTLIGTSGKDRLVATGCASSTVRGRGGDDEILRIGFDAPPNRKCSRSHMRAFGGAGDDRITGTINSDVLRGGPGNDFLKGRRGKDVARGGPGRDTCLAERTSACERR